MQIPFFHKENPSDVTCAPVCLRMALAYYGVDMPIENVYTIARSLGECHYTLPWGMCLGAASVRLHATFISRNHSNLLPMYFSRISEITHLRLQNILSQVNSIINESIENTFVTLLVWEDEYSNLPQQLIEHEAGVVIPTVWWENRDAHNIVVTRFEADHIAYHDPNLVDGCNKSMDSQIFFQEWLHENTDNDLLIISKKPLTFQNNK